MPMKKRRGRKKKLDFLRASRDLSKLEFEIIEFVWTWKVAPTSLVKEVLMRKKTDWQAYKIIRRLKLDGILEEIPKSRYISHRLLCVSELGFDIYLADRDFIEKFRFRVHAPAHDYLATAFHLSSLLNKSDPEIKLYSEQEIQTLAAKLLPSNLQASFSNRESISMQHFPDGLTSFNSGDRELNVGYEVEINLKPDYRYKSMYHLYRINHGSITTTELVFFLVRTFGIAKRIHDLFRTYEHDSMPLNCAFILMDDFIQQGSEAKIFAGHYKNHSLRKVHEILWQKFGNPIEKLGKVSDWTSFFPKRQSPMKSISSIENQKPDAGQTPGVSVAQTDALINKGVIP